MNRINQEINLQLLSFDPETGRRCIESEHRWDLGRCRWLVFSALEDGIFLAGF